MESKTVSNSVPRKHSFYLDTTSKFSGRRVCNRGRLHRYTDNRYKPYETRSNSQLERLIESCKDFKKQIESKSRKTKQDLQCGIAQINFTNSLKRAVLAPNKPIDHEELRALKSVLPALAPSETWALKDVTLVLYRLISRGVFTLHSTKNAKLSNEQAELLSNLLQHIKSRCDKAQSPYDLEIRSLVNVFWAVMELMRQRDHIENVPYLELTVMSLLPYVEFYSTYCKMFNSQNIATLLCAFDILTEKGLQVEQLIKHIDALMLFIVNMEKSFTIPSKDIPNILMPMAKLVKKKAVSRENYQGAFAVILRNVKRIAETSDKGHAFTRKAIANVMCSVGKLVDQNIALSTELIETVNALLLHVITMAKCKTARQHFQPQGLAMMMDSIVMLMIRGLEIKGPVEKTIDSLLLCIKNASIEGDRGYLEERSIRSIFCSLAALLENGFELTPLFQETVKALLSHIREIVESSDSVNPRFVCHLTLSVFSLIENNIGYSNRLQKTANLLLCHIRKLALANSLNKEEVLNILESIQRLGGKRILSTENVGNALNALMDNILAGKYDYSHFKCDQLLQIIALLGEGIELERTKSVFNHLLDQMILTDLISKDADFTAFDALLMHSARLFLLSETASYQRLEPLMKKMFEEAKKTKLHNHSEQALMTMAAMWLGIPYSVEPVELSYNFFTSEAQSNVTNMLKRKLPSIKIEEEKVLHNLPPVDLFLPSSKTCIEVQGPCHYIDDDYQLRNGKTLRKVALLKKMGYNVIEIPISLIKGADYNTKIIDKINRLDSKQYRSHSDDKFANIELSNNYK